MLATMRLLMTCLLLNCAVLPPVLAQPTPPPAEAFFQRPALSDAQLSPSGRRVAVVIGAKGSTDRLGVLDLETMKVQQVAGFPDKHVANIRWVNDKRIVFYSRNADRWMGGTGQAYYTGLWAVNADGSGLREMPWRGVLSTETGNPDSPDVWVTRVEAVSHRGADYIKLLKLNTLNGRDDEVETPLHAISWLFDPQGRLRAVVTAKDDKAAIQLFDLDKGQWRKIREFDRFAGTRDLFLHAIAPDGRFYVTGGTDRDTRALHLYDPATDRLEPKPVIDTPGFDIHPGFILRDGVPVGVRFTVDAVTTHWFDAPMKAHQAAVDKLLPSTANLLSPPRRGDSPWVLVYAYSDVQPGLHFVYHTGTGKLSQLGGERPEIKAVQMSPMDLVRYKARDGLEIPAYLTLPSSVEPKKNLPLIVYVHGGPWVRGGAWHWRDEIQFLASRGYAVLQPEFRGSVGYGDKLFRASFKQWGLSMQDDLADGARWAIAQGIADPKRICIMGASYGGYATLMGLAKDGDLFRCGVNWVGVSDILLMYDAHWSDMSDEWKTYGMTQRIGDREKDAARLEATSPVRLADRIRNPLLIAHGRLDRRVPVEHGERMRDALTKHNPNVEWVLYDREGHGWGLPETEVDFWTRVEKFLARHNGAVK